MKNNRNFFLNKAIDTYLKGFESDWRDPYPGINAVTLMEIRDPPDERREKILPVVTYAAERRISTKKVDYWDYPTLIELAVLEKDESRVIDNIPNALALLPEKWQVVSTLRNITLRNNKTSKRETG